MVCHLFIAKVSPEWGLNPGFGTQTKCPFPLNRGVPSLEVTNTKIMWTFFRDKILCPLNGGDIPKERFHCNWLWDGGTIPIQDQKRVRARKERFLSIYSGLKSTNWPLHFVLFQKNGLFIVECKVKRKTSSNRLPSFISNRLPSFIYLFAHLFIFLSDKRTGLVCNWRSFNSQ